jgi:hypothetical protein
LWPGDDLVRKALRTMPVDPPAVRPRLRMLIEAIEDKRRSDLSEGAPCERDLTVEHVMPLGWRSYWAPGGVDPATAVLRDTVIHTLGNLTLVRWKLNAALANLPWTDEQATAEGLGRTGKRSELANHSRLTINAELVASDTWTEATIAARTAELAETILEIWPAPTAATVVRAAPLPAGVRAAPLPAADLGHSRVIGDQVTLPSPRSAEMEDDEYISAIFAKGDVDEDGVDEDGSVRGADEDAVSPEAADPVEDAAASRYERLAQFLVAQTADTVPMTFEQLEDIMEDPLPPSARTSIPFWSSTNAALGRAIVAGGFKPTNVDLWNERVIFARDAQVRRPRRPRQHTRRRNTGRQAGLDR